MNLAVLLGAAVTTAVLTGALLVGDSVRGSLRELTLERLGGIDYALISSRFFREELSSGLAAHPSFAEAFQAAPAVLLQGAVTHADSRARVSRVSLLGVDDRFLDLYGLSPDRQPPALRLDGALPAASPHPPVVINQALAQALGAREGDPLLLSTRRPSDIHPEFVLGHRDPFRLLETLRVTVAQVIPDQELGRFSLEPHQHLPYNLFVSLPVLQRALALPRKVNVLFASSRQDSAPGAEIPQRHLRQALAPADLGLRFRHSGETLVLESEEMVLSPTLEEAARQAAAALGAEIQPVLTYLANEIALGERSVPYSTVSALDPAPSSLFPQLQLPNGRTAPPLKEGEILLNQWAAEDLGIKTGEEVTLSYYVLGPGQRLLTEQTRFRVAGIVAMTDLAVDRTLIPEIPGVQDAADMASWDPPVPIDLNRIRPRDETYWDLYQASPKAFVSLQAGFRLWESRFGRLTSIRISFPSTTTASPEADFARALLAELDPEQADLSFEGVKARGLEAAEGATDFRLLFIGFSFFLIISAALLVGLLFRLGVEQRAAEVGLLLALGFPVPSVRRRFLAEGSLVAAAGTVLGLAGACGYAWLLLEGLQTWWSDAVGARFLSLHASGWSLLLGLVLSFLVILFSIGWTLHRLARVPAISLLRGATTNPAAGRPGRLSRVLAPASLGLAVGLLLTTVLTGASSSVGLFFGIGAALLVSGLSFFSLWLRRFRRSPLQPRPYALFFRMAARNSARNPGRSLLSVALLASACFVIVAVGANRHEPGRELLEKDSGAGGFPLLGQSQIPLHHDLNHPDGRFELGFPGRASELLEGVQIQPLRLRPGEDISCLNLYQPRKPRLLGVPREQIRRGGFAFQEVAEAVPNPWSLLEAELEPGVIPAFGDANSVLWILHLGLGDELEMENEQGEAVRLRLVGLLSRSIFQSELLISEENFLRHFPRHGGFSYFLIEVPADREEEVARFLEAQLEEYGFDVSSTRELLAGYLAVENTYLSTFQSLGGLGLLLGTLGLAVIMVRNVLERRGELATLRAFGFPRRRLAGMILAENLFLLVLGLGIGTASALVAVFPHLTAGGEHFPWLSLSLTLLAVLAVGLGAGLASVSSVLRIPLLPALKAQ